MTKTCLIGGGDGAEACDAADAPGGFEGFEAADAPSGRDGWEGFEAWDDADVPGGWEGFGDRDAADAPGGWEGFGGLSGPGTAVLARTGPPMNRSPAAAATARLLVIFTPFS